MGSIFGGGYDLFSSPQANTPLIFSEVQAGEGNVQVYTQPGFLAIENQLYLPMVIR
jgi:hypothetical protein